MAKRKRKSRGLGALDPVSLRAFAVTAGKSAIQSAIDDRARALTAASNGKCAAAIKALASSEQEYGQYIGMNRLEGSVHFNHYRVEEPFANARMGAIEAIAEMCVAPGKLSGAPKRGRKPSRKPRRK